MDRTAIVILNYESYHEAEKCVDSILDRGLDVEGIVIVDNASQNESFSYLRRKYGNEKRIKLVRSNTNVGFAKGNNIGIHVAKATWKVNFVLLLNSDTIIMEEDYLEKLLNSYRTGIGVMQTSALRLNGRYTQKNYGVYNLGGMLYEWIKAFCGYYNIYFPRGFEYKAGSLLGPWVSGCDILLTPDYFKVFRGLYPLTFLYGEEYILAIMLRKAGLEWKVVEEAHILHAESRSTPPDFREGTRAKSRMMLRTMRHKLFARVLPLSLLRSITNKGV